MCCKFANVYFKMVRSKVFGFREEKSSEMKKNFKVEVVLSSLLKLGLKKIRTFENAKPGLWKAQYLQKWPQPQIKVILKE